MKSLSQKPQPKPVISDSIIQEAIAQVKKFHYLGSSNIGIDKTGGLSGYYRNVADMAWNQFIPIDKSNNLPMGTELFLGAIILFYTGSGNCDELTAALTVQLFSNTSLTIEQKELIKRCWYFTHDQHEANSYVKIDTTIYDLWSNKIYPEKKLLKKTLVPPKRHQIYKMDNALRPLTSEVFVKLLEGWTKKFGEAIESQIVTDRKNNTIYPTLDTNDPSNYALLVTDTFQYLSNKFTETFNDPDYIKYKEIADHVRRKIMKDFTFLIEELRQDIPLAEEVISKHKGRKKVSEGEVNETILRTVSNKHLATYVLAISYQNSNLSKCREMLADLSSRLTGSISDTMEIWLRENTAAILNISNKAELSVANAAIAETINRGGHPIYQSNVSQTSGLDEALATSRKPDNHTLALSSISKNTV